MAEKDMIRILDQDVEIDIVQAALVNTPWQMVRIDEMEEHSDLGRRVRILEIAIYALGVSTGHYNLVRDIADPGLPVGLSEGRMDEETQDQIREAMKA